MAKEKQVRINLTLQRQLLQNEFLDDLNKYNTQIRLEKQLDLEKKERIRKENEDNLKSYYLKKEQEKKNKLEESSLANKLFLEENSRIDQSHSDYINKITSMNNRIYSNARKFNKFITGNDNELFNETNDINFNKKLVELHRKEKHDRLYDPSKRKIQEQIAKDNKNYNDFLFKDKLNKQKSYRDFLDQQNDEKKYEIQRNRLKESGEQLLMPSYRYPNFPQPVGKKAFDSLSYIAKTPGKKDIYGNEPFKNRSGYLGATSLKHNPITCPVDDFEYNKYVKQRIQSFDRGNQLSNSMSLPLSYGNLNN